jgi:hypothetical protein
MIAKNGTSTRVARVNVPVLAIMAGCRGLSGARPGKIAVSASRTALSAANGAETVILPAQFTFAQRATNPVNLRGQRTKACAVDLRWRGTGPS